MEDSLFILGLEDVRDDLTGSGVGLSLVSAGGQSLMQLLMELGGDNNECGGE